MTGSIPPSGPLSYEGQVAVPYIVKTFDPLPTNNKFPLPTVWVNSEDKTAFISVSKDFGSTEWVPIGGIPGEAESLTGNDSVVVLPTDGNINVLGNTSTGLTFTGAGSTLTGTLNAIPNSALANSSITVGAGTGIGVSVSPVSLGGSTSISAHIAQSAASSVLANAGVASFNSADFTVDGNGFVSSTATGGATVISTQTFTSSGTYTPTSGMQYCIVEVVGGGGGGGGCSTTGASTCSAGGGGGGGGYSRKVFSSGDIGASQVVTIGAGGSGGAAGNNSGIDGGTTSLGSLITGTGGHGGDGANANFDNYASSGGLGGGYTGGNFGTGGAPGGIGWQFLTASAGGIGGSTFFGGGARSFGVTTGSTDGDSAASFGGGGGGAAAVASATGKAGGNGLAGIVAITEFAGGGGGGGGTDLHVSKFIVSPGGLADGANYTTISSAIAAASAGDTIYVMDGNYVEDLTLKSGVNIVSLSSFQNFFGCQGNAVLSGNLTDNGVGVGCNILGLAIVSTSGFAITTTAPGGISLTNCRISCINSTLVSMNDVLSNIFFDNCFIVLATTGISLYNITTGDLWLNNSFVYNTGGTVTLPTMTPGGAIEIVNSSISAPLACSGASGMSIRNSICSVDGVSAVTTTGTSSANIRNCILSTGGGAFPVLSIGSGTTITATNNTVISSATNVFTGAGTINTAGNACTNSSGNNVSTINHLTVI